MVYVGTLDFDQLAASVAGFDVRNGRLLFTSEFEVRPPRDSRGGLSVGFALVPIERGLAAVVSLGDRTTVVVLE